MLIISCIFDCLEPMLTIAAALSGKSVFITPLGDAAREEARQAKQRFADAKSDHLALVEVWKAWVRVKEQGWAAQKDFVRQNFLSLSALQSLEAVRNQIRNDLVACGFAAPLPPRQAGAPPPAPEEIDYRANEYDVALLKCILVAGLAPQIAKLVRPVKGGKGAHFVVRDGAEAYIHPSSVNAKRVREAAPKGRTALALFHRKVETTRVYLHDTTFVSSLALLLFGTHVRVTREHGGVASKATMVVVDGWIGFKMREESSVLLKVLKKKIDEVLLLKIARPHEDHVRRLQPVVSTIRKLLHSEMLEG
jgi:HrpA-like RNA helicase